MGDWQPIDTAPRDGTQMWLVWDCELRWCNGQGTDIPLQGMGFYSADGGGWFIANDGWPISEPVGWMPLPPPPKEGA